MHEYANHIEAKDGFQFLCLNGRFLKYAFKITITQLFTVTHIGQFTIVLLIYLDNETNYLYTDNEKSICLDNCTPLLFI